MNKFFKPWLLLLLFNVTSTTLVWADTTSSQNTDNTSQPATITSHMQEKSVHLINKHSSSNNSQASSSQSKSKNKKAQSDTVPTQIMEPVNASGMTETTSGTHTQQLFVTGPQSFPIDIDVPGQSFVSTGPYIGVPLLYSGGNLIINSPNINEDVTLLNMRKAIRERLVALGRPIEEDHAHLLLSGIVEGQVFYESPGVGATTSGVDVSSAELDAYILGPSSWTSGLLAFNYDSDVGTNTGALSSNSRTSNSRVFVSKAFITIGDFQKSPVYGSIGQMYVPFGTYSSNMLSSTLTKILGRTKERALLVGYQQQGANALYGSIYVFGGPTYVGSQNRLNNSGINLGYRYALGERYSGDVGVGVIANLADSVGMQFNGNRSPQFGGFGAPNNYGNEQLVHRVSALDLRGLFSIGKSIDIVAEYVAALSAFSPADLTFNTHGAKPQALNVEFAYTFSIFEKPSTIAVGYGKSKDGLALGLALDRYSIVFNTSIWKDTLQGLEFRHDINYAAGNFATGNGTAVTKLITGAGKSDNMLTAQFDIFF